MRSAHRAAGTAPLQLNRSLRTTSIIVLRVPLSLQLVALAPPRRSAPRAGPKWDRSSTTPVPAGSFVVHHPNKIHFDGAKDEEVTLQITGMGPSATKLVDESGAVK